MISHRVSIKRRVLQLMLVASLLVPGGGSSLRAQSMAPVLPSRVGGQFFASAYFAWQASSASSNSTTGTVSLQVTPGSVRLPDGRSILPYATNAPLFVDVGASRETVTPVSVANCVLFSSFPCTITAPFTKTHGQSTQIVSATYGLQEAINDAHYNLGGLVVVDSLWKGTSGDSMITSAAGFSGVGIGDFRSGVPTYYVWNGSAYVPQSAGSVGPGSSPKVPVFTGPTAVGNSTISDNAGQVNFGSGFLSLLQTSSHATVANSVGFQAPASVSSAFNFTLPGALPGSTQSLCSDASGVMSFGCVVIAGTSNRLTAFATGSTLGNSSISDAGGQVSFTSGFLSLAQTSSHFTVANSVGLQAPTSVASAFNLTLPGSLPVSNQPLCIDSSGVMSTGCSTGGSVGPLTSTKIPKSNGTNSITDSSFLSENGTQPVASANIQTASVSSSATTLDAAAGLNIVSNVSNGSFPSVLNHATTGEMVFFHSCSDSTFPNYAGLSGLGSSLVTGNLAGYSVLPKNSCFHYPVWFNGTKWDLAAEPHAGLTAVNVGGSDIAPAIQYVSGTGSDSADGLTPATPVFSVLQALRNLSQVSNPKAGTVYVANGAAWSSYTGEGLYLMGTGDANFSACNVSGFPCAITLGGVTRHWMKWNSARIIGLGGNFETNSDQAATSLVCGAGSACNTVPGPILAFSGVTTVYMENFKINEPSGAGGPSVSWGVGSDGNRGAGGSNSTFYNMQIGTGNFAGRGPALDVGGNTFELYFDHSTFTGNSTEVYPSTCSRASNVVTCTLVSGTFSSFVTTGTGLWLQGFSDPTFGGHHFATSTTSTTITYNDNGGNASTSGGSLSSDAHFGIRLDPGGANSGSLSIRDSHFNTGGISYKAGSSNWDLLVYNSYTENQPANTIGVAIDEGATPGNANLVNFRLADNGNGAITCIDTRSSSNVIWYPATVSDATISENATCNSASVLLQTYPGNYGSAQYVPQVAHQVGFLHNHVLGQTDVARRNFSPSVVKYVNVASQLPAWTLNNGATLSTVTGPDGISNAAGQVVAAGGVQGGAQFGSIAATFSAGDFIVAGVWEAGVGASLLSTSPAWVKPVSGSCTLVDTNGYPLSTGTAVGAAAQFEGYLGGDQQWAWESHVFKIYQGGSCTYRFEALVNTGQTQKYAYPVYFYVPAGTTSVSEIVEYVEHMSTYPETASVGDVTMQRGQRFSISDPQSNFFMKMTSAGSGLTADRIYGWPNVAGNIAVITGSAPANDDCAKFVVSGGVTSLTTAGAACGSGVGGVTSVGESFTGGLISVGGTNPVTSSGTIALTVAGTSGGIPYFSSASTWASSAALTANLPVIGGGAGAAPAVGTRSGNTTKFATTTGTLTNGNCASWDVNGNLVDNGTTCGGGGGGGSVTSVALAAPTGFSISGSPVTGAGTLTFSMPASWTTGDLLLGDGSNSVARLAIGSSGTFLKSGGTTASWQAAVTSVAASFTGGLISLSGSPITGSGTLAFTVAGTSGGIPYFSSSSAWASSAALTANLPVIGGGAGSAPSVGSRTGSTTTFATATGSFTTNDCLKIDASGNVVDAGAACGTTSLAFSAISSGTNTTAAMVLGSGSSLAGTGTATVDLSALTSANGFRIPSIAGALPTSAGAIAYDSTTGIPVFGSGGSTVQFAVAAGDLGTVTSPIRTKVLGIGFITADVSGCTGGSNLGFTWVTAANQFQCVAYGLTSSAGSANIIPKYSSATALQQSLLSDNGTTLTYTGTGGISAPSFTFTGSGDLVFQPNTDNAVVVKQFNGANTADILDLTSKAGTVLDAFNSSGALSKYQARTLAGNGMPVLLYSNDTAAQSASIGSTTMFTAPASGAYSTGIYLVYADIVCTIGQASTTVGLTIGWNNGSGTLSSGLIPTTSSCATTGSEYASVPFSIYLGASQSLTFSTAAAGFTTGRYVAHIRLEAK